MDKESRQREIEGVKKVLENPLLKYNERASLETYLKSLEGQNE
jgi:hypothetical protein